jgi:hypothetical protein
VFALEEAIITQDALEFEALSRLQGRKKEIRPYYYEVEQHCIVTAVEPKRLCNHLFSCFCG